MTIAVPPPSNVADLVDRLGPGTDVIVPIANGEPRAFLDEVDRRRHDLVGVKVHQMSPMRPRGFHGADHGGVQYVSYFLSDHLRQPFAEGCIELVPNDFHAVPQILRDTCHQPFLVVATSPPDRHGYVSMGLSADYAAALLHEVPVVAEVNPAMPRVRGLHNFHLRDTVGWYEATTPMVEKAAPTETYEDRAIAGHVAALIPDGATLQMGIGAVPGLVAEMLHHHTDLGIHTELLSDSIMGLVESGAVTGRRKTRERGRVATTFAMGSAELYEWIDDNPAVMLLPVDICNSPQVVAEFTNFCAINATMQVDLLGQCASESIGHHYVSSTGGQADFIRGADLAPGGRSFIVTHSTALGGSVSRIVTSLSPGAVVTAHKNLADRVVTEFGVAELKGRSLRQRAEALIEVAHPDFQEQLVAEAKEHGLL